MNILIDWLYTSLRIAGSGKECNKPYLIRPKNVQNVCWQTWLYTYLAIFKILEYLDFFFQISVSHKTVSYEALQKKQKTKNTAPFLLRHYITIF